MKPLQKQGFTLIEVVIVVAIMGIFAMVAIPNFISWLPRHRLSLAAGDVSAGLIKARSKAVKDFTNVVCNVTNAGLLAFVDNGAGSALGADGEPVDANNGTQDGSEPTVVRVPLPEGVGIQAPFQTVFDRRGFPSIGGNFTLTNSRGATRRILLSIAGSVQVQEQVN